VVFHRGGALEGVNVLGDGTEVDQSNMDLSRTVLLAQKGAPFAMVLWFKATVDDFVAVKASKSIRVQQRPT